jgi:glutathione S-transferase
MTVHNPLNKVPTLLTDDGEPLYDSRVICEYLDSLKDGGGTLFPRDPAQRWKALRRQVLADGVIDVVILKRDEDCRGLRHQSPAHQAAFAAKIRGGLDQGEREAADMGACAFGIGQIAWGCALSYFDLRAPEVNWRDGRPQLAAWYEGQFAPRPSALAAPFTPEGEGKFALYRFEGDDAAPA